MTNSYGSGRHHTRDGQREETHRVRAALLHQAWGTYLSRVRWEDFVTLTFDDSRQHGLRRERAEIEAVRWCGLLGYASRLPIGYALAVELSPGGRWHVHVLVVGVPERCWSSLKGMWRERNGRVDRQRVSDARAVALYTTKQAAAHGTVLWSDTLERYMTVSNETRLVSLIAEEVR